MGNAPLNAPLTERKGARHRLPARGKAQKTLTVARAHGRRPVGSGGFIAGDFLRALELTERKMRQRIPPVQADG